MVCAGSAVQMSSAVVRSCSRKSGRVSAGAVIQPSERSSTRLRGHSPPKWSTVSSACAMRMWAGIAQASHSHRGRK